MTRIYLVRHAEAEGNLFRVAHGQYNSTITPQGYQQLHHLRRRFADIHVDAVYGSDLLRAHTTASAIYVPKALPFHPLPLLREIRLGDWEQQTWGEIQAVYGEDYTSFNKRPHLWQAPGAETFQQVRDRMMQAIRLMAAENPGKTVAATSHGAALRTLLGTLEGLTLEEMGKTPHGDNTAVSLIEVDGDDIRVIFRDDASHVPAELRTFRRQSWHKNDAATEPGLRFRSSAGSEEDLALTAFLGGEEAGHISARKTGDALTLTGFFIAPPLRGQRYGVQLLGQAVQFARAQGLELIRVEHGELRDYFLKYGFPAQSPEGTLVLDYRRVIRDIP